jgi:hypothetical protein
VSTSDETQNELLPCPFCDGKHLATHPKMVNMWPSISRPALEQLTEEFKGGWRVCCYGCGVSTWNNLRYSREEAVVAWNTRNGSLPSTIAIRAINAARGEGGAS